MKTVHIFNNEHRQEKTDKNIFVSISFFWGEMNITFYFAANFLIGIHISIYLFKLLGF